MDVRTVAHGTAALVPSRSANPAEGRSQTGFGNESTPRVDFPLQNPAPTRHTLQKLSATGTPLEIPGSSNGPCLTESTLEYAPLYCSFEGQSERKKREMQKTA